MIIVLAVVAVAYLLICLLAFAFQSRLVYFPQRELEEVPEQFGLSHRDVHFAAADRVKLHGWFFTATEPRGTLLFCHGNAGNISHRIDSVRLFLDLHLSVFIFDYRGYGRSAGRTSEEGTYRDARAAWQWLVEQAGIAPDRIVLFGRSLGGAVAVELATHVRPQALIVEATFNSAVELGARAYPWLPVRQLSRIRYDSASRIRAVRCPKLFIHSPQDEVVPYGLGLRLYRQARPPKQWLKIRGGHSDGFLNSGEMYVEGLESFLQSFVSAASTPQRRNGRVPDQP